VTDSIEAMSEEEATILVVEDDVDVAEMLTSYFREQGYGVVAVNWGEDALKSARATHPDLVILDIRLPDIDGFEVARRLRSNQRTQDIPIIFLTEKRERSDRIQGLEIGADDYITKPFDIQELRLRVRNSLRRTAESPLNNPVTGLPDSALVDERLRECLKSSDWAMLLVAIENLGGFREKYGFVASDDVQRAVSLMLHNAMRGLGSSSDFIGQLSPTEFILVTQPGTLPALAERIRSRLEQSLDYFYPLKDREEKPAANRLGLRMAHVSASDGPFRSLESLKARLQHP
jgi:DNA-binding response OmpR family regulator